MKWVTFKTQVTIFMPRLITFGMKTVKEVEELLCQIKQGRSILCGRLYTKELKIQTNGRCRWKVKCSLQEWVQQWNIKKETEDIYVGTLWSIEQMCVEYYGRGFDSGLWIWMAWIGTLVLSRGMTSGHLLNVYLSFLVC